jgi:hypothetical protein
MMGAAGSGRRRAGVGVASAGGPRARHTLSGLTPLGAKCGAVRALLVREP